MSGGRPAVMVVGAGPAGLYAAERLAAAGATVTVFDHMASPARKLLLAGRGGLNLTHSEPREAFLARYGNLPPLLRAALEAFPPPALRAWVEGLGQTTFVGSSGRVFPVAFKASPLVRAWLARLSDLGVTLAMRHRFVGFPADGSLAVVGPEGPRAVPCDAALLALGGASWPRMGSDGGWTAILRGKGIAVADLRPANMGIEIDWTADFRDRFAGQPLKPIALTVVGQTSRGEAVITTHGLEGGAVYALTAVIRDAVAAEGSAVIHIDLKPDAAVEILRTRLDRARAKDSLSSILKKQLSLPPQAIGLLREATGGPLPRDAEALASLIKAVPLGVTAVRALDRAISTAGGVRFDEVGDGFALTKMPGVFVAGEMLDWEAPTGGYLLQATFASAEAAAQGMARRLGLALPRLPASRW
ncbi:TIGR03862 family flavoprotein [Phreatobacter sp. HK31-P]